MRCRYDTLNFLGLLLTLHKMMVIMVTQGFGISGRDKVRQYYRIDILLEYNGF